MNRPKEWYRLPSSLTEWIVDLCDLQYDSYESSHVEAAHSILCNPDITSDNGKIIQEKYESLSDSDILSCLGHQINNMKNNIDYLIEFRDKNKI